MTDDQRARRECGPCTACCTILGVAELHKPVYVTCQHVCEQGCSIYNARPQTCRDWSCDWKNGFVPGEDRRPDKLGIIFDLRCESGRDPILCMWEVVEGAARENAVRVIMSNVYPQVPSAVLKQDGTAYNYWNEEIIQRSPYAGGAGTR
jgi:hypothetical protein